MKKKAKTWKRQERDERGEKEGRRRKEESIMFG